MVRPALRVCDTVVKARKNEGDEHSFPRSYPRLATLVASKPSRPYSTTGCTPTHRLAFHQPRGDRLLFLAEDHAYADHLLVAVLVGKGISLFLDLL